MNRKDGVFWHRQQPTPDQPYAELDDLTAEQLEKLGYHTGYRTPATESGVQIYHEDLAWNGTNLFTSGHAPAATLMDMRGNILHQWRYKVVDDMRKRKLDSTMRMGTKYIRRAHLFQNGDLLALFDYCGIVKLNKESKKLWFRGGRFHHDFYVTAKGEIYALSEVKVDGVIFDVKQRLSDNRIVILNTEGRPRKMVSLSQCFRNTYPLGEARRLLRIGKRRDLFHTNSVQVIESDLTRFHPALKPGNVLISIRTPSMIAVIDMELEQVALTLNGQWRHQHEATLDKRGRIILFDNTGKQRNSRILELTPRTWKVRWAYAGDPPSSFFSRTQGTQQRLPNGNVLVTESNAGRAFEVTRAGAVVWEFVSPYHAKDDEQLVAVLFYMHRVDKGFSLGWSGAR